MSARFPSGHPESLGTLSVFLLALAGAVIGAAFAFGYAYLFVPKVWEASALVLIGQVGDPMPSPRIGFRGPRPVESAQRVIERIDLARFENAVLTRLELPLGDDSPLSDVLRTSLRARYIERANLVSISVRGLSPDTALKSLEAVISELSKVHDSLAEPAIQRLRKSLENANIALKTSEKELETARAQLSRTADRSTSHFSEGVLAAELLNSRQEQARKALEYVRGLEEQVGAEITFSTRAYEAPYVPERPVHPNRGLFALAGAVVGAALALVFALFRKGNKQTDTSR